MYGKYGVNSRLCPVSFGLSLGITTALAVLICTLWMVYYGVPPAMAKYVTEPITLTGGFVYTLLALFKGFIFGFFVALFYDFFISCCKSKSCCKNGDKECGCGPTNKNEMNK